MFFAIRKGATFQLRPTVLCYTGSGTFTGFLTGIGRSLSGAGCDSGLWIGFGIRSGVSIGIDPGWCAIVVMSVPSLNERARVPQ